MLLSPSPFPMFFIHKEGQSIVTPPGYSPLTYEVELGVVIGTRCKNIHHDDVIDHVGGYCVALDITAMNKVCRFFKFPYLLIFWRTKFFGGQIFGTNSKFWQLCRTTFFHRFLLSPIHLIEKICFLHEFCINLTCFEFHVTKQVRFSAVLSAKIVSDNVPYSLKFWSPFIILARPMIF